MAKSLNVVHEAVEKASKVSPRDGKWATPKEIDVKATPKQTALQSSLAELVRDSRIEKMSGRLLYRPQQGAGPGGKGESDYHKEPGKDRGGKDRWHPRRPDGKKPGRRDDGKPDGGKKPGRRGDGKPSDDPAERERQRKRDYMNKSKKTGRMHKKFVHPKDRKSNLGRTIARGVGTQAVSAGIGQSIGQQTATKAITSSILM
jgi:hypothetical protein